MVDTPFSAARDSFQLALARGSAAPAEPHDVLLHVQVDLSARVVRLFGELDCATARLLGEAVAILTEGQPVSAVNVDVSGVRFVDRAGLQALTDCAAELARRGVPFQLKGGSPVLTDLSTLAGVDALLGTDSTSR